MKSAYSKPILTFTRQDSEKRSKMDAVTMHYLGKEGSSAYFNQTGGRSLRQVLANAFAAKGPK